ncbi:MAG: hypothetical protein GX766_02015 [Firmicutes bacterium]|nr:hypothetical protein [Bacillota bacterium]HQD39258.1 hypothetical protein [Bacillota bacterium]
MLTALLVLCFATASSAQMRLGLTAGGGYTFLNWDKDFLSKIAGRGFPEPKGAFSFYGGSEFRLNEKWLLHNLGQGFLYQSQKNGQSSTFTVGMWTLSACRIWEVKPGLELGGGVRAGIGTFSLRLDYGEQDDPLEANVRELMDKFFLPLGLIGTVRYKVGMQTFVIEASYQQPLLLEQKLYSGWQLQAGLSYDLGY